MFYRKGQGLSIETTITILIAILVLVVIILIFQGKGTDIFEAIRTFISGVSTPQINYTDAVK